MTTAGFGVGLSAGPGDWPSASPATGRALRGRQGPPFRQNRWYPGARRPRSRRSRAGQVPQPEARCRAPCAIALAASSCTARTRSLAGSLETRPVGAALYGGPQRVQLAGIQLLVQDRRRGAACLARPASPAGSVRKASPHIAHDQAHRRLLPAGPGSTAVTGTREAVGGHPAHFGSSGPRPRSARPLPGRRPSAAPTPVPRRARPAAARWAPRSRPAGRSPGWRSRSPRPQLRTLATTSRSLRTEVQPIDT